MAGITVDRFWTLTLHEINLAIRGYYKRLRQAQRLAAWHAAHVSWSKLNPSAMVPEHEDDL